MGKLVYHLFLMVYRFSASVAALSRPKVKRMLDGKKRWHVPALEGHVFWMHCSSKGEFEQGRPLLEMFKRAHPDWKIAVSFFSSTGMDHVEDGVFDAKMYLPWDSPANASAFLDALNPNIVCFVKYEFWYHFLSETQLRGIPLFLVSGIFRKEQLFFKWYGGLHRSMLQTFDRIMVQNRESLELLSGYPVDVTGDMRIDRVSQIARQSSLPSLFEKPEKHVFIAGSVWPDDMDVLIPVINEPSFEYKVIIAPHEIDPGMLKRWESRIDRSTQYYSTCTTWDSDVLFLDTVGMLSSVYRIGEVAYIGGGFGDGLHNILEPAVYGLSIYFGDREYDKFQEAHDLLESGVATAVGNSTDLKKALEDLPERLEQNAVNAKAYIARNEGATQRTMEIIETCL